MNTYKNFGGSWNRFARTQVDLKSA